MFLGKGFLKSLTIVTVLVFFAALTAEPGATSKKRPLSHDDYDSWKTIRGSAISANGNWLLYLEVPQDGEADLVVTNLQNNKEYRHTIGYSGEGTDSEKAAKAQFSYDATQVVFLISPSQAEVKKYKKAKKKKKAKDKPLKKLGIMDLADGKVSIAERIKSFKMPKEAGGWLAYLKEAPPKPEKKDKEEIEKEEKGKEVVETSKELKGKKIENIKEEKGKEKKESKGKKDKKKKYGTRLILHSLKEGKEKIFEDVLLYYFSKDGENFFFIVSSKKKPESDGLYRFIPGSDTPAPLLSGKGSYKKFAMNKHETMLAFLTDRDDQKADESTFNLYGCKTGDVRAALWVSHTTTKNFPRSMAVSDKSDVSFSEDGRVVMFGIKEIPEPKKEDNNPEKEKKAKFELWHWNDPYPQPQQKKLAKKVHDNTYESVYHIKSKRFVKLADKDILDVLLNRNGKVAYGETILPYTKYVSFFGSFYDIYVFDVKSGKKTLVRKKLYDGANLSPNGKYVYWYEDKNWYVYNIASKVIKNITASLGVPFDREDWDTPNPPRSYGILGWTDNDASILIYDRYDIWEITPDGAKSRRITEGYGRENHISFRYVKLDPEEITVNPRKTLLLRATHVDTMAAGFYRDQVNGNRPPEKLIMAGKRFDQPRKAKNAEIIYYTRFDFDEYPDIRVTDLSFNNPRKITDLGRQMEPFTWGKEELRSFFSSDGKPLKGVLIKPDHFDPQKKYPLMVYIYETLHNYVSHRFRHPGPGTSVNPIYYVSNGYVMWLPDIEYDTGYPGKDALKCVLPGIEMLIREGFINPEAIGIQGHSWGGYQIAYMVTQTNIFAAAEAGAPVSNMTSAYGGIRWGSGMVRQFQYERSQSRLGDTLWRVPLRYIENSPLFRADKVRTPLLMIHNDEDGAVPWYQGIEFMMALRRLEREAYMFNYNGEKHGLRKRVNQMHWTKCMQEFFDHHLKGAPAPGWMKEGIKAWDPAVYEEPKKTGD